MKKIHAAITGIQGYVPDYILDNKELEKLVDTNDEWIVSRTGIKERRILKGQKGSSDLGVEAIKGLLKKTNTSARHKTKLPIFRKRFSMIITNNIFFNLSLFFN